MRTLIAAALLALVATSATAAEIHGHAHVIDGNTVVVAGTRVRLEGVDAGSHSGEYAKFVTLSVVGKSDLRCTLTSEKTKTRAVGTCFNAEGVDINADIIESLAAESRGLSLCPRPGLRAREIAQIQAQVKASSPEPPAETVSAPPQDEWSGAKLALFWFGFAFVVMLLWKLSWRFPWFGVFLLMLITVLCSGGRRRRYY